MRRCVCTGILGLLLPCVGGCLWAPELSGIQREIERQMPGARFEKDVPLPGVREHGAGHAEVAARDVVFDEHAIVGFERHAGGGAEEGDALLGEPSLEAAPGEASAVALLVQLAEAATRNALSFFGFEK